jgi:YidC/Oxa1 family membrane protein insertase
MDRDTTVRTLVAVVLSIGVLFVWSHYFGPEPPPPGSQNQEAQQQTADPAPEPSQAERAGPPPRDDTPARPGGAEQGRETEAEEGDYPEIRGPERVPPKEIDLGPLRVSFDSRGGRISSLELVEHRRDPSQADSRPINLISPQSRQLDHYPLSIATGDPALDASINREAWYRVRERTPSSEELAERELPNGTRRVDMDWADGQGIVVHKTVYLPPDGRYLLRVEWEVTRRGSPIDGARLAWGPGVGEKIAERTATRYAYRGRVVTAVGAADTEEYDPGDVETDVVWPAGAAPRWLALESQYFAVAMVPETRSSAAVQVFDGLAEELAYQDLGIATSSPAVTLFAGPKSDQLLYGIDADMGTDLKELVHWGFFGFIARPVYLALAWLKDKVGNWGVAIVIVTLVIRILFFPLTQKAMISMRVTQQRMGKLQPKIRKIKEKYKDKKDMESRRKLQEETMAVYKQEGVNPMSTLTGCLPLLLQLPVLYAMYTVLSVSIDLRGAEFFGWLRDLSAPDPYYVTPLVMGASMLLQQLMSLTKTEDPQQRSQQRIMMMMPLFFTFFFLKLPSGLVLYWLVNNILGIGQQVLINRRAGQLVTAPAGAEAKKK